MLNDDLIVTGYTFDLSIPADEYQRLYRGTVKDVIAIAHDGRRVRFAARLLRPFVGRTGIKGRFRILTDENNCFLDIEKIG